VAARGDRLAVLGDGSGLRLAVLGDSSGLRPAARRLQAHTFEAEADRALNLVGFSRQTLDDIPDGAPSRFDVGGFRFSIAWSAHRRGASTHRIAALLADLPEGEESRRHEPVFGLRLHPGTASEVRMSICFRCNNIYLDGGARRAFDAQSIVGCALVEYLLRLVPDAWACQVRSDRPSKQTMCRSTKPSGHWSPRGTSSQHVFAAARSLHFLECLTRTRFPREVHSVRNRRDLSTLLHESDIPLWI
jgi:hypothetical protein